MKILGVVGGIAPVSTVAYYQELVAQYRQRHPTHTYPQILINSIDLNQMLGPVAAGDYDRAVTMLRGEVVRLANAGADVALFASNTPHLVFDRIAEGVPIPLISIVRATREEARRQGLKRLCLLGARFIMAAPTYPNEFAPSGMTVVVPSPTDREDLDRIYQGELINERFTDENREKVLRIIDRVASHERIDGVILGGTELPLLLPMSSYRDYPLLNTLKIHVAEAVTAMLG